jgi:hypothetical protein
VDPGGSTISRCAGFLGHGVNRSISKVWPRKKCILTFIDTFMSSFAVYLCRVILVQGTRIAIRKSTSSYLERILSMVLLPSGLIH